jgi:nucleotide-binding universal stress UspA family protein
LYQFVQLAVNRESARPGDLTWQQHLVPSEGPTLPPTRDRASPAAPTAALGGAPRPVVLGTLSVRIDPSAEEMAIASALEAGVPLIVVNVMPLRPYPATNMLLGPGAATLPHEEDLEAVRATAQRAAALGIHTELLRVTSQRPVRALLEIARERDGGLLVFGPDIARIRRRRLRRAARALRRGASCLVWIAPDGWLTPDADA